MVGTSIGLKIELDKTAKIASFPIICFDVPNGFSFNKFAGTPLTIRNYTFKLDIRTDLEKSLIHRRNFFDIGALRPCHFALDKRLVIF